MSLDVHLYRQLPNDISKVEKEDLIILHENYADYLRWDDYISFEEWFKDNSLIGINTDLNITHNLGKMASEVPVQHSTLYMYLWRPEEINITKASELIEPLTIGLAKLKGNPEYYKQFDSPNGWGLYIHFVPFVEKYLQACIDNPDCIIKTSR